MFKYMIFLNFVFILLLLLLNTYKCVFMFLVNKYQLQESFCFLNVVARLDKLLGMQTDSFV